jgi:hypothetical protein
VSDYEQAITATRNMVLEAVTAMPLADQLRQLASFHETAQLLARTQFGERDTAISQYHALMSQAASKAADHFAGMN